jgi:hypothetical protein
MIANVAFGYILLQSATQDLFELLERVQSSRLDDQRCVLPPYFTQVGNPPVTFSRPHSLSKQLSRCLIYECLSVHIVPVCAHCACLNASPGYCLHFRALCAHSSSCTTFFHKTE